MQNYIHTPETFNIFYNETTTQLKEQNNKLITLDCYKETLLRQEITITRLESELARLQEKNTYLEQRVKSVDTQVHDLNKTMMKYFDYNKIPKASISSGPSVPTYRYSNSFL